MKRIEYIHPEGQFRGNVPLSLAVKAGHSVVVYGSPGFDKAGRVAIGNFAAQMRQSMENVGRTLNAAGTTWERVVRVGVLLTRREDVAEMNRIYATCFPAGRFPARTTSIVQALPQPEFLVEIECQAVLPG